MELQGKKTTHDFLSLYTNNSAAFQHQDPQTSSPSPSQGLLLKTHDFLRPLERPENNDVEGGEMAGAGEHVLPGEIGTYSIISHVTADAATVKAEGSTCGINRGSGIIGTGPESGYSGFGSNRPDKTLWDNKVSTFIGHPQSPAISRRSAEFRPNSGSVNHSPAAGDKIRSKSLTPERKPFMDDEDDELKKPEASSSRKELSIKVDGKGSGNDQRPNTPRSKHSATEQRRRSKINDRFQILRGIIPHSDQKRDKASFLLEVIEYIRFMQEKVNKYETQYPEWNQEPSKLTSWHNSQAPANGSAPAAHILSGSGFPGGSALISSAHNTDEIDASANAHYKTADVATDFPNADYTTSQDQSLWLRASGPTECGESGEMLNEQEDLIIDEGTINVSTAYSQELMMTLGQTLQHSGLDLSQASISVQISLGKRAINRRNGATAATSNSVDPGRPESENQAVGHSKMRSNGEESSHAAKRPKS